MHDITLITTAICFTGTFLLAIIILAKIIRGEERVIKVSLVLSTLIYKNLKIEGVFTMANFKVKEFIQGILGLVKHADGSKIDATFANETFVSADESIAVAVVDPTDGPDTAILDIKGIAVGETDITVTSDVTYIDPNTSLQVTKSKSAIIHVVISAPVSEAETDLVVTLGDPQPVPATA